MTGEDAMVAAQAEQDQPGATLRALDAALAQAPGHIPCTVLVHHPSLRRSERFRSNMPDAEPVGGREPVTDGPWMRQVIFDGRPWICRTAEDVRDVFHDHELIRSLGCESMLNVPVRWRGQTMGTLNLSHRAGFYDETHVAPALRLAYLAPPALLMISRQ